MMEFLRHGVTHVSGWSVFTFTMIVTHITIASVTIYLHRHQAHRSLEMHPALSHFFRFWLWLTTGQVTKEWAAIHRKHHAKCDVEGDPHSPVTLGIKKVLLQGAELYRTESKNRETLEKFGHGTPDDWIERNIYTLRSWWGVVAMLGIDVLLFGVIGVTVWAVQMLWIPITAAGIINGIGHYWGYRNFNCADAATNVFPFGILIGGEELHNNHHTFATSAKLSSKWYEFDIGWLYIRTFEILGLVSVQRVAPRPRFIKEKAVPDAETLRAVITNRYDVMTAYGKSIQKVWHTEREPLRRLNAAQRVELVQAKNVLRSASAKQLALQRDQLAKLFAFSCSLAIMHEMRFELTSLWARSHASSEQLLTQLQDWCTRAEDSGVEALRDFSFRLRSYA
jgi:stearoyl-CoA desaturase (delta-9 desaturase)